MVKEKEEKRKEKKGDDENVKHGKEENKLFFFCFPRLVSIFFDLGFEDYTVN